MSRTTRSRRRVESSELADIICTATSESATEGSMEPNTPVDEQAQQQHEQSDEPPKKKKTPRSFSRELASLTQWGDWMAEMCEKKAATSRRDNLSRQMEEERLREEQVRAELRARRQKELEELQKKARIAAEEEKQRREEERLRLKHEREVLRLERLENQKNRDAKRALKRKELAEESDDAEEPDLEENILETRTANVEPVLLVDGYRPFLSQWRSDVEIPIRETFFVDLIHQSKTSEVLELIFKTAADVVREKEKKYRDYRDLEPCEIKISTPVFSHVKETYYLRESKDFCLDPLEELGRIIEAISLTYIPENERLKWYNPLAPYESLAGRYSTAFYSGDYETMFSLIEEYNAELTKLQESGAIEEHLKQKSTFSRMVLHEILNQVYSRSVSPHVHSLKDYRAFSNNVYGELLPKFCSMVFDQCGMDDKSCFIDLGSGVGNVTIQAALEYGSESYGCEIMDNCCKLAELQEVAFKERTAMFGMKPGKVAFFHRQSFVGNTEVKNVIDRSDIILVNNFLFTPDLNKETLLLFLDIKVGTKIISLKKIIPEAVYHDLDDEFLSMFLVEKHSFGSGCVSWTDNAGIYYITTFTGQVSEERRRQLNVMHNTRRRENEFLSKSAVRLSHTPESETSSGVSGEDEKLVKEEGDTVSVESSAHSV